MKKVIAIVLALVMTLGLAACSGGDKPQGGSSGGSVADAPHVELKLASQGTPDSLEVQTLNNFAELVNERSGGSITVTVYPSGQLGNLTDMIEGVTLGTIEMCEPGLSNLNQICADFAAYDMWFYDGAEDVIKVYNSEVGRQLNQKLIDSAGVRLLSYINCSAGRMYLWAKQPIKTMDDFNGLIIRVPGNASIATALSAISTTANVGFGDMYTAAQTGVIDVGSADIATMLSNGFDEIFPYCVEITGNYMPMSLVISEDVFQKLTAEQQEVVTKAAEEACQYWDDRQDEVQQGAMDMLAASKAEMCRMEPAELAKMDDIIHDAMEKYLSETIGADLMAQVRALTD